MVKKHSSQLAKAPAFKRSALALCISAISQGVWAGDVLDNTLPEGGVVRAGDASINTGGTTAAPILNIDQLSQRAIVDWAKFNVGKDATVNFNQPNANASTLNRISGGASQILGRIQAPGEVVLVNPEGMYFGKSSTVNVGALIASVNNISDEDYMAGRMIFERDGATGSIVNEGEITTALGGYIAMLAPEVRNTGVMLAQLGTIALAAGDRVTLNFGPNNKLTGITADASTIDALIENKHAIMAPGGLIILSARGVNDIASGVIKQSGELSVAGNLQLVAEGGKILITADKVELAATSKIDASVQFDANVQQQLEADLNDGGEVVINAVELNAAGAIDVSAVNAGDVKVTAKTAKFEKATITSEGEEQGGNIEISAVESVEIIDTEISADAEAFAGDIWLQAIKDLPFEEGSIAIAEPVSSPTPSSPDSPELPTHLAIIGSSSITSRSRAGEGGQIVALADDITLDDNALLSVTGATAGGDVLVGGDWQGGANEQRRVFADPDALYEATTVYMGENVTIDASATENGDGGTVVLWSDISKAESLTSVHGHINAKAGLDGGDGGAIETSGAGIIFDGVSISTAAPNGTSGQWLLDPSYNITDINTTSERDSILTALESSNVTVYSVNADIAINMDIISTSQNKLTFESGRHISINRNVRAGALTFNATQNIYVTTRAVTLTANRDHWYYGRVVLSSNYNSTSDPGGYNIDYKLTIRTNGGDVNIGGGSASGYYSSNANSWHGIDFAGGLDIQSQGGNVNIRGSSNYASGLVFRSNTVIDSDGGNIYLEGTTEGSDDAGVYFHGTTDIDSGTGTLYVKGFNSNGGGGTYGILFHGSYNHLLFSENTTANAIRLYGEGFHAVDFNSANYTKVYAVADGGGITVKGFGNTHWDVTIYDPTYILAKSGPISILGDAGGNIYKSSSGNTYIGSHSNSTAVPTSSSDITIRFDFHQWGGGYDPFIATSGDVVWESKSASFNHSTLSSHWFNYNNFGQTMNSLRIGKTTNTTDISVDSALTATGPISIYGGAIGISSDITASGDISVIGSGNIDLNANIYKKSGNDATLTLKSAAKIYTNGYSISSTSNKLNTLIWVESDGGGEYGAYVGDISTNGGHLWIGGGSGSMTWNGLTVGSGLSMSGTSSNANGLDLGGNILTNGGDVYLAADRGRYSNNPSIGAITNMTINSGDGDITLIVRDNGDFSYNSKTISLTSTGTLTIAPPSGENWDVDFSWNGTGATNLTGSGSLTGLIINNQASLGGLTLGQYLGTGVDGDSV